MNAVRHGGPWPVSVAIVAAGREIVGGHSVQAQALGDALVREQVQVRHVAINRPLPKSLTFLARTPGVRTVVNEVLYGGALTALAGAEVVHAFSASYWSFLLAPVPAMLAARAFGARVVLHYHSGEIDDHLARWGRRVHPWLRLADEIVVCSEFQQRVFERYGHRTVVIPNVVDAERFAFRERRPVKPRFLCNRNLERHYGVDVVIDAFAAIRAARPDATLVVAGAGSESGRLREQVAAKGLDGVHFVGAVPAASMPALLDAHDVMLNASRVDNQPVSIIEAFAAGLAVVSTPTGGIVEMIENGRSGLLVRQDDSAAMARAALSLIEAPERTAEICARAREAARHYAWDAIRERWAAVYRGTESRTKHGGRDAVTATRGPMEGRCA